MPMDALCLSAVLAETAKGVVGGRIDKVYQPSRDEILLHIRHPEGPCRLLLSANPSRARLQLTALPRENPAEPPMFCMLLRKYLVGGKILSLRQPPMERLAELDIEAANEMGDKVRRRLVLEAMGRRANLLLLDDQGRIVDCLRRVEGDLTQARPLLPGLFYKYPPMQEGKGDPAALTEDERAQVLDQGRCDTPADRFLLDRFLGLSPLIAREVAFEAFGEVDAPAGRDPAALLDRLTALVDKVAAGQVQPTLLVRQGEGVDFSFRPILQYGPATESRIYPTFAALLDEFYQAKETADHTIRQINKLAQSSGVGKELEAERTKLREKLDKVDKNLSLKNEKGPKKTISPKKLKIGDGVKVLTMNLNGTVSSLPNAKGDLYVQMGILRSLVNIKDLELLNEPAISGPGMDLMKKNNTGSGKIKMSKSFSVSPEVNLIGMTVDEAIPVLDKYLDDAYLAHLPKVRVVHGRGPGALKAGAHKHLKKLKYVKEFRLGDFGEGDTGVTIVTFK